MIEAYKKAYKLLWNRSTSNMLFNDILTEDYLTTCEQMLFTLVIQPSSVPKPIRGSAWAEREDQSQNFYNNLSKVFVVARQIQSSLDFAKCVWRYSEPWNSLSPAGSNTATHGLVTKACPWDTQETVQSSQTFCGLSHHFFSEGAINLFPNFARMALPGLSLEWGAGPFS